MHGNNTAFRINYARQQRESKERETFPPAGYTISILGSNAGYQAVSLLDNDERLPIRPTYWQAQADACRAARERELADAMNRTQGPQDDAVIAPISSPYTD